MGCKNWMSLAHPMAISIHVMASLEGRSFERFSRFWVMMGWNSCVWTLKSLPENGDYEIFLGLFLEAERGNWGFFSFFWDLLGAFFDTKITRIETRP